MEDALLIISVLISFVGFIILFMINETSKIKIKEYTIKDKKVMKGNNNLGIKIVFFSDLHIGKLLKKHELIERLEMLKKLNADLYVFGGDLIGIDTCKYYSLQDVKECFSILNDKPCISIKGNHEYKKIKNGNNTKLDYYLAMGFLDLENEEYIFLKDNKKLSIFGMQESIYHNNEKIDKDYDLLISHQGDVISEYDNQIMLSGHTHGGQIRIPLIPIYYRPKLGKKYTSGVHKINNSTLLLSNGLGYGGMKIRLFSPCDILVIDYIK